MIQILEANICLSKKQISCEITEDTFHEWCWL